MPNQTETVKSFKSLGDLFHQNPSLRKNVDKSMANGDVASVNIKDDFSSDLSSNKAASLSSKEQGHNENQSLKNQTRKLKS